MRVDRHTPMVLALWNDVDPAHEAAYNDWHAGEHVPERLTVPGMEWGARYRALQTHLTRPVYLTLYGLHDAAVLESDPYQRLLAQPTPTSQRMRPLLRNVVRAVYALDGEAGPWTEPVLHLFDTTNVGSEPVWPGSAVRGRCLPSVKPLPWLQAGQGGYLAPQAVVWLPGSAVPVEWADRGDVYQQLHFMESS